MKLSSSRALGAGALMAAAAAIGAQPAAAMPAFYTPPATLPSGNGVLVRNGTTNLTFPLSVSDKGRKIMYTSTDTNGNAVAVTGTYMEPRAAWRGGGARPLVTFAEGTQGQGDQCAPSLGLENIIGSSNGQTNVGYEIPNVAQLMDRGFAVVVTDYMGLGTPGVHTYVNRVDQGHAVLDAARAAFQVPGASVNASSPVGAFGYSQGGGAVASAAELAPTYAPELNLKGVAAGAPPADLNQVMKTADGTTLTAVIGFAVNGFVATYPQLKPILDANTNASGKAALAKIANSCIGDGITYAYRKTSEWTTTGQSISTVVNNNPVVKAIVDEQTIGKLRPSVPVRISTGTMDDIVTHSQVKNLATAWCAQGASVTYVPIQQNLGSAGTALNHLGPSLVDGEAAQDWLAARLRGTAIASNCSSVARLP